MHGTNNSDDFDSIIGEIEAIDANGIAAAGGADDFPTNIESFTTIDNINTYLNLLDMIHNPSLPETWLHGPAPETRLPEPEPLWEIAGL